MKKKELFELRLECHRKFENPSNLLKLTNKLIKNSKIPLITGMKDDRNFLKNWKLEYLTPKKESDELTVRNYLEGLRKIEKLYSERKFHNKTELFEKFGAFLLFNGLDNNYEGYGTSLITLNCQLIESRIINSRSYGLNITWNKDETYHAESKIGTTPLDDIMELHMGPNIEN